ncbi:MAG: hypothetical protein ACREON_10095 [Gemmatimonadaceae bacterium]
MWSAAPEDLDAIIQLVAGGPYRFSVHDFTNGTSTTSRELGLANAPMQVFASNNTKIGDFNVPNQAETLWTVFELTGTLQAAVVRATDTMAFQPSPSAVTKSARVEWRR